MYIYRNLFTHLSTDGRLSRYYLLGIMNNVPMNIQLQASMWTYIFIFFLDIKPGVELLGFIVIPYIAFWETSKLFLTVAAWFYIWPEMYKVKISSHSYQYLSFFFPLKKKKKRYGHPSGCMQWYLIWGFICISWWPVMLPFPIFAGQYEEMTKYFAHI